MPGPSEPLLPVEPCQPAGVGGGPRGRALQGGFLYCRAEQSPPTCPPGLYLAVPCSPVLSCLALV